MDYLALKDRPHKFTIESLIFQPHLHEMFHLVYLTNVIVIIIALSTMIANFLSLNDFFLMNESFYSCVALAV